MGSTLRAAVELSQMGEQYMLARYLSNNIQHTDRVPMWLVEDVCQWLQQTGFRELCQVFRQVGVDGDLLLPLREKELTQDFESSARYSGRRFLRELRNLKRMSDYSCVDAEEIAEFLSGIQPDFREYTYDVYLTCPVRIGAELCSLIKINLERRGISVFHSDPASRRNDKIIQDSQHFVLVLPKDSLDCMKLSHSEPDNKIRAEIVTALEAEVNIIPVTDHGFQWLARDDMHEDVRDVPSYNSVRWVHEYQDACITKLDKFIRGGDNQLKIDSPYLCRSLARSRQSSGRSTPLGMSRKSSATPFSGNLLHPRNISLRKSSLSLYSNDSGVDNFS